MSEIKINDEFLNGKDIKINQQEYKTGLVINGKDEYIRIFEFPSLNKTTKSSDNCYYTTIKTDINLSDINIIEIGGVIYGNTGNAFTLDTVSSGLARNNIRFNATGDLIIITNSIDYARAQVYIKYIYN